EEVRLHVVPAHAAQALHFRGDDLPFAELELDDIAQTGTEPLRVVILQRDEAGRWRLTPPLPCYHLIVPGQVLGPGDLAVADPPGTALLFSFAVDCLTCLGIRGTAFGDVALLGLVVQPAWP